MYLALQAFLNEVPPQMLEQEIYTTPKYAATERFQDIIAEVVRAHLQRAGGSSCDLAALVNRRNILRGRSLMLGDFVYRL